MKKFIPIVTIILLVLVTMFLVGCTTERVYVVEATTTSVPDTVETTVAETLPTYPTTTTERATTTVATLSPSDMFLADVYANTDLEYSNGDSELIDLGWTICEFLGSGYTGEDVIEIILEAGAQSNTNEKTMLDYAALSGLAVAYLCPEYGYKL